MRIQLEPVKLIGDGDVWQADVRPSEIRMLLGSPSSLGSTSVIVLLEEPQFDKGSKLLTFDPTTARLLNVGSTSNTILIFGSDPSSSAGIENNTVSLPSINPPIEGNGDQAFLNSLPLALRSTGEALLAGVRGHFGGELKYYRNSRTFVEQPDNFWAVRIQPRDASLRVTVRGDVEDLPRVATIAVAPDRRGYIGFKVRSSDQILEAVSIIRHAIKKKH